MPVMPMSEAKEVSTLLNVLRVPLTNDANVEHGNERHPNLTLAILVVQGISDIVDGPEGCNLLEKIKIGIAKWRMME